MLLKASLVNSVGIVVSLWACSVSAQVAVITTVHKQQTIVAAPVNEAQLINSSPPVVLKESRYQWVEASTAAPGDKLLYTLNVENIGRYTVPKGNLRIEDKVPEGSSLAAETFQQADVMNSFSVSADGLQFVAAASAMGPPEGWRWLRWEYLKSLKPGQSYNLSFHTTLQAEVDPQNGAQRSASSAFQDF